MVRNFKILCTTFLVPASFAANSIAAGLPAFPGAEGFGALATGGRGGSVYHVTNLDDAGPGSFRDAVSQPDRIIVFDVGGIIKVNSQLTGSNNLTIAGQTAPGEGIMISGHGISFSGKQNVIVRHLRLRSGIGSSRGSKVLNVSGGGNMIFDHLSIAWGRWDNLGFTEKSHDLTLQNCLLGEAIDPQRFGALIDSSTNITVVRNLWTNHSSRSPKGKAHMQYINNVVYNWGGTAYGGGHSGAEWNQDLIGNYFIKGPNSSNTYAGQFSKTDLVYHTGNLVDLEPDGTLKGRPVKEEEFKGMKEEPPTFKPEPFNKPSVPVKIQTAQEAYETVVETAGAYLHRDKTDTRLIAQLMSLGTEGAIIKEESEVGGPGELAGGEAPKDTDRDGMPDAYEAKHGFNPNDPADGAKTDASGYMNVEVYINSLLDRKTR
ncbi:MAG: hypothetical protein H7144_11940 [Burkholderiales bacterium]|nr:hypothetical protein [Phycisphaerae bacterium]